LSNTQG